MSSSAGYISARIHLILIILFLFQSGTGYGQKSVLDSLCSFNEGSLKTSEALGRITRMTGYNFTYDTRLIDSERITDLNFSAVSLREILEKITGSDSLEFSVIDRFIIFSRKTGESLQAAEKLPEPTLDYITGTVNDRETGEPLPFATIALKNKGRGTVANAGGEFGLKISSDMLYDTLSIAYLGYLNTEMPLQNIKENNVTISLNREYIAIPGIIIKNQIPQEIIHKAVKSIPDNYSKDPVYLTCFYREGVLKRKILQNYSEAILKIYKTSYSGAILGDQIKVLKSRKIENTGKKDTLTVRLKAGLSTCNELDGVKKTFDFIKIENMADYLYMMTDIVPYEDESVYAIDFEQKQDVDLPLYKGTVYINTLDYAILNADFELNEAYLYKMKDAFIANSTRGFTTWPVSVKYSVSYRKFNDIYYLNHVRGDLQFASKRKRRVFNSQFSVFFEMAVTDIDNKNVIRFDRDEVTPVHSVFSRVISNYDPSFWGNQDFLRPEDDLLKEIKNMKVNLEEFNGQD